MTRKEELLQVLSDLEMFQTGLFGLNLTMKGFKKWLQNKKVSIKDAYNWAMMQEVIYTIY